jgi:hypothetical protein
MSLKTSSQNDFEELWSLKEIAGFFKVCKKTARRRIVELDVPTVRIGRQIRVRASHVLLLANKKW